MAAMLRITRIFDAPRAVVYRAFTDPDQLAAWFGPAGWSVPRETVDMDVRTGGHQRFTMVNDADPSLTSPVDAVFAEVVANELIVGDSAGMRLRLEFHDEPGGRTRLELVQGPYTPDVEGQARDGWTTSFVKLAEKIRSNFRS